ncbi:hypothetical protein EX975_25415 [Salmonella enterica subsp. enterica serovar Gaminara]|uniref:Uncharacterized protein n=1 Tax=Salmonella enterica subsp. enterica serovar Gaminara TaxID=913070 RepID=A0A5Z6PAL4_SALET|nr:hypothetical protein [Salmonella enterica]EBG9518243.1 hypothetical protein [Salmonella enterica subsp. enterica serovar Gaminara]EDT8631827.1 hypothetical protein [Salmonella enterica subsp. enterica serovar Ohio]EDV6983188.1 hypothetical protein [Salmonella enterica subsp. enterica serovar Blockley]EHE7525297.1 hypothetical protein [Salmonella enterica subsp. enterica serovar Isangi]AXE10809.1 hypothetical protein LFZ12_025515 [Salmonella enterica subsp. enterica serovar Gaminara str. SA2
MSKTTTLSLRIDEELKQAISVRATASNKTITDYVRGVLSETHAETVKNHAKDELQALEEQANRFALLVEQHGRKYEKSAGEIARLGNEFNRCVESARDRLDKDSLLINALIGCSAGFVAGVASGILVLVFR